MIKLYTPKKSFVLIHIYPSVSFPSQSQGQKLNKRRIYKKRMSNSCITIEGAEQLDCIYFYKKLIFTHCLTNKIKISLWQSDLVITNIMTERVFFYGPSWPVLIRWHILYYWLNINSIKFVIIIQLLWTTFEFGQQLDLGYWE